MPDRVRHDGRTLDSQLFNIINKRMFPGFVTLNLGANLVLEGERCFFAIRPQN